MFDRIRSLTVLFVAILLFTACRSGKSFTLALLPDTQTYTRSYPEIFEAQTNWLSKNAKDFTFVLHQGDITDNNIDEQWTVAQNAMQMLDGKIPYCFVYGNHDAGSGPKKNSDVRNTTLFNRYFPYSKFSKSSHFGGAFETGKMDNAWFEFKAAGKKWMILNLEFGPRNKVLDWATSVVSAHPQHKVIINTHAYMYSDDTRMSEAREHKWRPQSYGLGKDATGEEAVNDGEQMWEKLVSRHKNIVFVFSGHVLNDGTGRLVSTGVHGNKVYQVLANYQAGVQGTVKGGNGFLRLVTIIPKAKKVLVKTYSPYTNEYKTDNAQQFTFDDFTLD